LQTCNWQIFPDAAILQAHAADEILTAARMALQERGRFLVVLAGGTTPNAVYRRLREADTDWSNWHIFFGDERCLSPDDPERNSKMAFDAWLAHVPIPAKQIHTIPAEFGAEIAAKKYCKTLAGIEEFDLVLLGLGEDGHTASLFPGHILDYQPPVSAIPVFHSPKPPAERVSMSATRLSQVRRVMFLVTGEGKRRAVQLWRSGANLPAAAIMPNSDVEVFVEQACL